MRLYTDGSGCGKDEEKRGDDEGNYQGDGQKSELRKRDSDSVRGLGSGRGFSQGRCGEVEQEPDRCRHGESKCLDEETEDADARELLFSNQLYHREKKMEERGYKPKSKLQKHFRELICTCDLSEVQG